MTRRQLILAITRAAVGVGLLALLTTGDVLEWSALLPLARGWPLFSAALLVLAADLVVTSSRLSLLLRAIGLNLPIGAATRLSLIGLFFNLFLPGGGGGDLVRIYYAAQSAPGRGAEITTVMVLDRVCGAYAMILLPVLLAPMILPAFQGILLVQILVGLGAAAAFIIPVGLWILLRWNVPSGGSSGRHTQLIALLGRMYATARVFRCHLGRLARAVAVSLGAHALSIIIMLMLAEAMLPAGADPRMALLIPLGFLANTLPITPGGLGVGEAAMDGLFGLVGLSGGAELLLAWRLLSVPLALAGLGVYIRGRRRWIEPVDVPLDAGSRVTLEPVPPSGDRLRVSQVEGAPQRVSQG